MVGLRGRPAETGWNPVSASDSEQLRFVCLAQASEIKDIGEWKDPLAAIIMYTFDLSILSAANMQEDNFYFKLNKVKAAKIKLRLEIGWGRKQGVQSITMTRDILD